jgi:carbonic anhydrase/acetyltransferase-like protein (isoleucine patch superfamily)
MIHKNVVTDFSPEVFSPDIEETAYVHPLAAVIGNVILGKRVMVAPCASVRGDEGQALFVGDDANVQDGVIIHALETFSDGKEVSENQVEVNTKK